MSIAICHEKGKFDSRTYHHPKSKQKLKTKTFVQFPKHQQQSNMQSNKNKRAVSKPTSAPPKGMAPPPPKMNSSKNTANDSNRGLSVMIPRAKYYSQQCGNGAPLEMPQQNYQHHER